MQPLLDDRLRSTCEALGFDFVSVRRETSREVTLTFGRDHAYWSISAWGDDDDQIVKSAEAQLTERDLWLRSPRPDPFNWPLALAKAAAREVLRDPPRYCDSQDDRQLADEILRYGST